MTHRTRMVHGQMKPRKTGIPIRIPRFTCRAGSDWHHRRRSDLASAWAPLLTGVFLKRRALERPVPASSGTGEHLRPGPVRPLPRCQAPGGAARDRGITIWEQRHLQGAMKPREEQPPTDSWTGLIASSSSLVTSSSPLHRVLLWLAPSTL